MKNPCKFCAAGSRGSHALLRKFQQLQQRQAPPWQGMAGWWRQGWPCGRGAACGMTLIELLVVIAVVGILGTLVITGISGARQSALQVEAASKLRNIGLAIQFYTDENDGQFPGPLRGYQKPVRINNYQLLTFIEKHLSSMQMPTANTVNTAYVSKAYSGWLQKSNYATPASISGADVYVMYTNHADADGNPLKPWGEPGVAPRMTQQDFYAAFEPAATRAMWDAQGTVRSPQYNEIYKGRNVLFFDWHVERVSAP